MKLRFVQILVIFCFCTVAVHAQKADISVDKKANFSSYKTYSWGKGTPAPNPLTDQWIISSVERRLAVAGWQKVESNGELDVIYHVSVNPQTTITSYSVGGPYNGYQWGWYNYGGGYIGGTIGEGIPTEKIQTITVGELVVDIADVKTKNFIWRGAAKETLKDRDFDKIKKKVTSAISKLFKNFPPTPGKK